jgi:protein TonB
MSTHRRQKRIGLLPVALVLSAGMHLGLLGIDSETTPASAGHDGQYGLMLELIAASRPAATMADRQVKRYTTKKERPAAVTGRPARSAQRRITQPPTPKYSSSGESVQQAAASAAGSPTVTDTVKLGTHLQAQVRHAMQPYFNYPLLARRRGWQGTVRLGLRILPDGHISRLHIVETSRHPVLDQAALTSLGNVKALPQAVTWLGGRSSDIIVPVEYRLKDS